MAISKEFIKCLLEGGEGEKVEFKHAEMTFDRDEILKYCSALGNEGGGYLLLGVADDGSVVGTQAFSTQEALRGVRTYITDKCKVQIEANEVEVENKRILAFRCPPHLPGTPSKFRVSRT